MTQGVAPSDCSDPCMGSSAGSPPTRNRPKALGRHIFWPIGLIGGMFGGVLGIGGGSAIAPLLLVTGRLRPAEVSGTTLAVVVLISTVGSGAYASLGNFNLGLAWPIAVGSVAGSVLGALTAKRLSMRTMVGMFLLILPYFAFKQFWPGLLAPSLAASTVSLGILGFGTGVFSGLLGLSGASLVVPSLVGFFLIDQHSAQGIAISVALADSIAGAVTHARAHNVNYRAAARLAIPAVPAAVAGALLSDSLSVSMLRSLFGVFMLGIWAIMLLRWTKGSMRTRPKSSSHRGAEADASAKSRPRAGGRHGDLGAGIAPSRRWDDE